jgi:V8-like Glu-specific endopeptidase
MASNDPHTVVSSETKHRSATRLSAAEVTLEKGSGGRISTGSQHPTARPAPEALAAAAGPLPEYYLHPESKYVLVEEPDKRFRLVSTAATAHVTTLQTAAPSAGVDNRVRITNTAAWPNCVHGHCIITYPDNKQYIGSGTMVNKHHVLTAGHVVYSQANGGWATSIQFNAAQNDATLPFGSAFATYLFSFTGWTNSQLRDYDTGMLILDRDLGNQTGWMGLITTSDGNLSNHQITVAGYPGDKGGQQLWAATAPIVSVASHQIGYNAYTKGGDSGAGVYGLWQGVNLEHVCADHVAGPNGIPNTGSRLATDKFNEIVKTWFAK